MRSEFERNYRFTFKDHSVSGQELREICMRHVIFEVCAETMEACLAAHTGGAARIELCSALSEGGLTPSHGFLREAVMQSGLPIHAMVRPRGGSFIYTAAEIEIMRQDILHMKSLGVAGVVLGVLHSDGSIDVAATRELVLVALPLQVTFHRAFDSAPSLSQALEDVIAAGCDRVLTSGGADDVSAGADSLAALVAQAAGRIEIAVGGGLRLADAARLANFIGAKHFHASLRQTEASADLDDPVVDLPIRESPYFVRAEAVKAMIGELQKEEPPHS
jgi:copper homeostasis protein